MTLMVDMIRGIANGDVDCEGEEKQESELNVCLKLHEIPQ